MKSKYPIRYVVDSRYFDGTCLTSMSDGIHNDYGNHETIEEIREREKNQFLLPISVEQIDLLLKRYTSSLQLPFEEITEKQYYDLLECVPPLRRGSGWFFVSEEYSVGLHSLCFQYGDRYFTGLRNKGLLLGHIGEQIQKHIKTISFRGAIVKDLYYQTSQGNNPNAKCTPYNFIGKDGRKVFLQNVFSETNDTFTDKDNRSEMAKCLLSLRSHYFQYWTVHGTENLFEFFKWIQKHKYTIQVHGELFDYNESGFVDFHGSIAEYSKSFRYRIYDRYFFSLVINLLRTVKREHIWQR